jgi:hypothetical protein
MNCSIEDRTVMVALDEERPDGLALPGAATIKPRKRALQPGNAGAQPCGTMLRSEIDIFLAGEQVGWVFTGGC